MKDLCLVNSNLYNMIEDESKSQIAKWGVQDHSPFEWLAFTLEELGETSKAITEWYFRGGNPVNVVKEGMQVVTLSLKIVEMFLEEDK